jgi:hypothetical protein
MTDVINLRVARKKKQLETKQQLAQENRAYFGLPKSERVAEAKRREKLQRSIDGSRLEAGDEA